MDLLAASAARPARARIGPVPARRRADSSGRAGRRAGEDHTGANALAGISRMLRSSRAISCALATTPGSTLNAKYCAAYRLPS